MSKKIKKANKYNEVKQEKETIIIKKIENSIKDKKNEIEIIKSDIYLLKEISAEEETKEQLEQQYRQIKQLLKKIEKLKKQIKIYKNDKLFDDAIYLDKKDVIDDILEYKNMINSKTTLKEEYRFIENYAIITEEIEKINERCIDLEKQKNTQLGLIELQENDIELIEQKLIKEDENINSINDLVSEQISAINNLEKNIGIIDEEKEIITNYDMFNKLLSLELKYVAIMSLSPLKGVIPYLAIAAKQTKDTIDLILSNPLVSTEERIKYIAKDYINEIENTEYKLNDIEETLNESICAISNIKDKIKNNENLKRNPKYEGIITKLEKLEEYLDDNKSKLEIQKIKIGKNKTKNEDVMTKVLILNKKN